MSSPDRAFRLAVSLRVVPVPGRTERRDALSQDWYALFAEWGVVPILVPNTRDVRWLDTMQVDGVLLTGGNTPLVEGLTEDEDSAPERDVTEAALLDFARERRLPVLGVCRGAQMMAVRLGGRLHRVTGHVATVHDVQVDIDGSDVHARVNSYHGWAVDPMTLPSSLRVIGRADDGTIEAFVHADLPWLGVSWHPERPGPEAAALHAFVRRALFGGTRTKEITS